MPQRRSACLEHFLSGNQGYSCRIRSTSSITYIAILLVGIANSFPGKGSLPPRSRPCSSRHGRRSRSIGISVHLRSEYAAARRTGRRELEGYLRRRLQRAGCDLALLEPEALEVLHQAARGLPQVNGLAHYALAAAALDHASTLSAGHVERARGELKL